MVNEEWTWKKSPSVDDNDGDDFDDDDGDDFKQSWATVAAFQLVRLDGR